MRVRALLRSFRWPAVFVVMLVVLAGCLPATPLPTTAPTTPSDGAPGSPPVPIVGQSRLTADQLVAYYQSHHGTLAYRATGATLAELADLFVTEGNRYNVRGDLAFAQAIVETGWFNYPDAGIVRPGDNNFAGIGACGSCGDGYGFSSARSGVRAQLQLLRNYADVDSRAVALPDPPVPELWGLDPTTAAYNFDHFFAKGRAPTWNEMGNGNWATAPDYATVVVGVYNRMLSYNGLGA
jgi:hypothetical protein